MSIDTVFSQVVERFTRKIAIYFGNESWSYGQLSASVNQISTSIARFNSDAGRVATFLEPGPKLIASLLGIIKSNRIFTPVDPSLYQSRITAILEQAAPDLIITTSEWLNVLDAFAKEADVSFNVLLLDELTDNKARAVLKHLSVHDIACGEGNPSACSEPEALFNDNCYLYYTSGSTGIPKGIIGRQSSLLHFIRWEAELLGMSPADRVSLLTPQTFDPFLRDVFLPLLNGGSLCIPDNRAITFDPNATVDWLQQQKITIIHSIPTVFSLMLEAASNSPPLASLRYVLLAGETLKPSLAGMFFKNDALGHGQLINLYGPSETTLAKLYYQVKPEDSVREVIPVGKPIKDTEVYIANSQGREANVGEEGEILISTPYLSSGYLNLAEENAHKFVLNPLVPEKNASLVYRTGDIGCELEDGNIEIRGRMDFQIKIHGQRVELAEIERALDQHSGIKASAVRAFEVGAERKIIAAYVVLSDDNLTITVINEFLRKKLPEHLIPAQYQILSTLPLSHNGKVDRKALPEPRLDRPEQLSEPYETPQGSIEKWFAELWQDILQIEPVGRHDSFFELGGRSIQAMKFLARVNQKKGHGLQVADLFTKPTLAQLALMIEKGSKVSGVVHLGKAPENFRALSDEQRRLCFFQQFNADNPVYNMPYKIKWQGYVNPALLQSALKQIVEDQEALQMGFITRDEEFSVFVDPDAQCMIQEVDFSSCEAAEQQANQWLYAEARKVFQLEQAPLLRFYLVKLSTTMHWVFVNIHHVIADAWSFDLFWQQLIRTYQALLLGGKPPEHQLAIKLSDYIYWQQQLKSQPGSEQVRQYWTDHLRDSPSLIQLPHDKPQPVQLRYCGAKYRFSIPSKTAATLRQLAKDRQVSLFSVMLAAFKVFLYRYTDQKDLVVGVPVANRFHHKLEPLIGFLVNILCYRSRITDDDKFQDYIHDIHQLNIAALRHKDMPFDELVDLIKPDRNLGHSPLFQVMFAFQERTPMPVTLRGAKIGLPLQIDNGTTKYDLTLQLWDQNTYFDAEFEFSTDLFETQTVARMADNFLTLLADIADQPCQTIGLLKIISQQEQQQLISWNNTQKTFSDKHCIHELISRQAQCTPQATAVIYESTSISYRQLDEKSNQLANFLINNGVALGAPVAVSVDRSIDLIVAFLGVLKSGGIYVPVDPDYPLQRRQYMLADSRSRVLITQEKYKDNYTDLDISQFFIDKDQLKVSEYSLLPAPRGVNADSSAYIIYTSGSTGQPKGVEIVHRGICNLAEEEVELLEIDVNSRVLQFASFSFDTSIWEIVMTLVSGASLVMADRLSLLPGPDLLYQLKRHRISHLTLPASALATMPYDRLPNLKVLIVAGEACTLDLVKKWGNGRTFINSYGPTEVTVSATNAKLTCNDPSVHIGRPLANTQIWLLNSRQQLVPIGAAGELYVGGVGLARGYYHKPEITAERFIDNPLPWSDSKILYKTGDLARYLSNGNIEFLGRVDQQVKIRGYRIELTEVEYNLKNCRDVQDAVVLVRDDILEDKCLVAYVTTMADSSESERSLKNHLAQSLPGYMIPIRILFLDMFPRLPNNKVDRAKLPKPSDLSDADADQDVLLPNTPEELALAEVWQQLLGLEMICCKQSFFQLGGHSLLAAKAVAKLARDFQLQLSVREFFNQATIQYLAGCCTPLVPQSQMDGITLPLGEWAPFSFAQQRIWFLDQLSPESAQYNICQVKEFSSEYDSALLVEAINRVLQGQDIFCLRFKLMEGLPCQQVNEFPQVRLLEADIQTCSQAEILQQAQKIANTPLRLLDGQHYHLILKRNDRGLLNLIFSIHHLLADEQSLVLFDELIKQVYLALSNGCREPAEKKRVRYIEFAYWEQKQHQQGAWQSQLDYWQKTLANRPETLPLPFDSIITNDKFITHQGAVHHFSVPNEVCVRLRQVASKGNTTTFVVWLAIFFVYLYRYTGERDIVVGIPVAVRHAPEFEDILGLFLNTVIIRKSICSEDIFTDFLAQLKQTVLHALDHKEIPFDKVTDVVQLHRSLDGAPIINVMLVHQIQGKPDAEYAITSSNIENKTAKFDLTLFLSESDGQLRAKFEYRSDKFKQETIAYLSDHLVNLAQQIAKSPDTAITHLELLSATEKQQLIYGWNRTEQPKAPLSVIEKFEQCAQVYPKRIAAESAGKQISYETLNAKANQLAHYLMDEGIGRELLVAVLLPRGMDLLVALLGILKAGAAYIPIDPNNPQERIQYILQDSSASFVITHSTLTNHIVPALHDRVEEPMVFCMDQAQAGLKTKPNDNLGQTVKDHQLAYVIYTSGSTGKPKGVLIEHGGFNNYINFAARYYEVDTGAGNPVHLSIAFDATITSLFTPLTCGQKLILLPEQDEFHHLLNIISEISDLSFVKMTPAHLDLLNQALPELHRQAAKCFILGGEALNFASIKKWRQVTPEMRIVNEYGPTEAVVGCCIYEVGTGKDEHNGIVPIGRPIDNTRLYVLDADLQMVPIGVTGELYIGGAGVARGYLNRKDLTAEKFVADPFVTESGSERLYKTGDLVKYLPDGNLVYIGRIDDQIKIRGYRVELGEIEAVLADVAGVSEACVVLHAAENNARKIIAYVVLSDDHSGCEEKLRSQLAIQLPEYMVPAKFVILKNMPLTQNGKNDRSALALRAVVIEKKSYTAPTNHREKILVRIWQEVLQVVKVGITDNFFELGGDSILSLQIVFKARQNGLQLDTRQIFEHQTIAQLAIFANDADVSAHKQSMSDRQNICGPIPLSPMQYWLFEHKGIGHHNFNQSYLFSVEKILNINCLEQAFLQVINHHMGLRKIFSEDKNEDKRWSAEISKPLREFRIETVAINDSRDFSSKEQVQKFSSQVQSDFVLDNPPLIKVIYFKIQNDTLDRLLLVAHHGIIDNVSWQIIFSDIEKIYTALIAKRIPKPLENSTSIRKWIEYLHAYKNSESLQKEYCYWHAMLQDYRQSIPVDFIDGVMNNQVKQAKKLWRRFDIQQTNSLLFSANRSFSTKPNELIAVALVATLAKWMKTDQVKFDVESHGRVDEFEEIDLSRTVGWLTALYPVIVETGSLIDLGKLIKVTKEVFRSVPKLGIGFGVLNYLEPAKELDNTAEICFNYLGNLIENDTCKGLFSQLAEEKVHHKHAPMLQRHYLLEIDAYIVNGELMMEWTYCEHAHHHSTISRLADGLFSDLENIINYCMHCQHVEYTPADFPRVSLSISDLEKLQRKHSVIDDLYPMSPVQEGMLFHALFSPNSTSYFEQLIYAIPQSIQIAQLQTAWQYLLDRHDVLRTCFVWKDVLDPVQLISSSATIPWFYHDWSSRDKDVQQSRLEALLFEDRLEKFDLQQSPLCRINLIKYGEADYRMVISHHHAILDGWSMMLLLQELQDYYSQLVTGNMVTLSFTAKYREYIKWLQANKSCGIQYWQETLGSNVSATPLPLSVAREAREDNSSVDLIETYLDEASLNLLEKYAHCHHLTINTLLQGAWALLLHHYTGCNDVIFGMTTSGRSVDIPSIEEMVGLFINTVPIKVSISNDQRIDTWLAQLQISTIAAQQFAHVSLTDIQEKCSTASHKSLFQTIVVFENYPVPEAKNGQVLPLKYLFSREMTNYPLAIVISKSALLKIKIVYDTSIYSHESAQQISRHLSQLLQRLPSSSEKMIRDLSLLDNEERQQVIYHRNQTEIDCRLGLIHEEITAIAEQYPDRIALRSIESEVTYRVMDSRANQLAQRLMAQGIGTEDLVAICLYRSIEMVISLLAVLKAGAAYLPVDPGLPEERMAFMIENSAAALLITEKDVASPEGIQTWILSELGIENSGLDFQLPYSKENQPCYLIYTSGSTGTPKGVVIEHKNLANYLNFARQTYSGGKTINSAVHSSMGFDATITSLYLPLITGGTVNLVSEKNEIDALAKVIAEAESPLLLKITPVHLKILGDKLSAAMMQKIAILIIGGEALNTSQLASWREKVPSIRIINEYGPTETVVGCSIYEIPTGDNFPGSVPIGKPIGNTQLYILDDRLEPVADGVAGELYIAGAGVGRGYLKLDEKTRERFIQNPYTTGCNDLMYKSGDLAKYNSAGIIEYIGRSDQQIKMRGHRIEIGEIEAVLLIHPAVNQAAVIFYNDGDYDNQSLIAFVSSRSNAELEKSTLFEHLKLKLPMYMMPEQFVIMDELPVTVNGKINRDALLIPEVIIGEEVSFEAPISEVEKVVCAILEEVLNCAGVGRNHSFFALGGHSLKATRVISRIYQLLDVSLSLRTIFDYPVVKELAEKIDSQRGKSSQSSRLRLQRVERKTRSIKAVERH